MSALREKIESSVQDGIRAIEFLQKPESLEFIENCAAKIASCFERGGKLMIAGNGGSLCDAMHFAEELSGLYREKRPAMAAMALSDPGLMSCVANDIGYEKVFSRALEALGRKEDIFIGLTTSGNSPNILEAVRTAKQLQIETISFIGRSGGALKGLCDLELLVDGFRYSDRVQEAHMTAIHIIIEMVETLVLPSLQTREELLVTNVS